MTFPAGKYDDQADTLGLIGQILDKMISGNRKEVVDTRPKVLSTNVGECTVTLDEMFEANERRSNSRSQRIR
jgi:hypothetical protein